MNAAPPRLTIVLPLRGRHLFTLRFLWHANKARVPYRILIADGMVHPLLARILENSRESFPRLDIEYVRYPDDTDFRRFYAKMSDAVARVRTPYAMLVDNDDFLSPGGIDAAVAYLDANSDYVCASGRVAGFSAYSGLDNPSAGVRGRLDRLCAYFPSEDVTSSSAADRVRQAALELWIYYSVIRTDALATVQRELAELDFSDLQIHEAFHVMRVLTLGKARADQSTVSYLRQYGTSLNLSFKKDWVHHLVRSRFTNDVQALVERISGAAAKADAADAADASMIAEDVRIILERKFRQFVWASYGNFQKLKWLLRARVPRLVRWLQNRPRFNVRRGRAVLLSELKAAGASNAYLSAFRSDLALIEDVLGGDEFARYLEPYLLELGADDRDIATRT